MSEYQWVEFRAIESPLDREAIEFMHTQSSRAEIDQWRFANEYHYGDFHGDALEMLRRGYDLHVHYSNFGNRTLYFRFHDGFQFAELVDQYTDDEQISWQSDEKGSGGMLMITPDGAMEMAEEIWDPETLASDFVPLWEMINRGDMRPVYLAYLALCTWFDAEDDNDLEPPVPAGLKQSHPSLDRLCVYLEVDIDLLDLASEASSELQDQSLNSERIGEWLKSQDHEPMRAMLQRVLCNPHEEPQRLLREIAAELHSPIAPTESRRSLREMRRQADERTIQRKEAIEAENARKKAEVERLARKIHENQIQSITKDPNPTLLRIEKAIEEKNRPAYERAASDLKLLQEAFGHVYAGAKADEIRSKYSNRPALLAEIRKALEG
ncbi:hypothetical protein FF011L_34390 [Roseimaritima multifibrata]|uniref:Uncharacterized protein n=1 Tax=Roseimaritima multifibrata TaxID=1930274 RepID=A0A517MIF3_9BACT|nr:hypothetical protein [Roseimaritima multifibrata]QDS94659.1 hypothetical protein FF011L_34390 [Roseimaritima multifibrata]